MSASFSQERYGDEIIFTGGKYYKKKGWKDKVKGGTESMLYMLVQEEDHIKDTHVKKEHVWLAKHWPPKSYEEAVLLALPELEKKMRKLAKELVKCNLAKSLSIISIFQEMIANEEKKKHKANDLLYYAVQYKPSSVASS